MSMHLAFAVIGARGQSTYESGTGIFNAFILVIVCNYTLISTTSPCLSSNEYIGYLWNHECTGSRIETDRANSPEWVRRFSFGLKYSYTSFVLSGVFWPNCLSLASAWLWYLYHPTSCRKNTSGMVRYP